MAVFQDADCELFNIQTKDTKHRHEGKRNKQIMTDIQIVQNTSGCQTEFDDVHSTQTDDMAYIADDLHVNTLSTKQLSTLQSFLNRIDPMIVSELEQTSNIQHLFNDYNVQWENAPNSVYLESTKYFNPNDDDDGNNLNANTLFGGLCIDSNSTNKT